MNVSRNDLLLWLFSRPFFLNFVHSCLLSNVERDEENKKQDRKDGADDGLGLFSESPLASPRWRCDLIQSSKSHEEASDDEAKRRRRRCRGNRDDDVDDDDDDDDDDDESRRPQGHQAGSHPGSNFP